MALEMARMTIHLDIKRPSLSAFRLGGFSCFGGEPPLDKSSYRLRPGGLIVLVRSPLINHPKQWFLPPHADLGARTGCSWRSRFFTLNSGTGD
jgi:hypothetical protein